jgi:hypothetical protein
MTSRFRRTRHCYVDTRCSRPPDSICRELDCGGRNRFFEKESLENKSALHQTIPRTHDVADLCRPSGVSASGPRVLASLHIIVMDRSKQMRLPEY